MSDLRDLLDWAIANKDRIGLAAVGAIVGASLTRLAPYLWRTLTRVLYWFGERLGGRFALRSFERRYLDWVVTHNSELRLTGVVSAEDAKKPKLEQIFVSIRVAPGRSPGGSDRNLIDLVDALTTRDIHELYSHEARIKRPSVKEPFDEVHIDQRLMRPKIGLLFWLSTRPFVVHWRGRRQLRRHRQDPRVRRSLGMWLDARPAFALRAILRQPGVSVVLGSPGSGKSTLLQYIALTYARHRAGDSRLRDRGLLCSRFGRQRWRVPILLRLSELAAVLSDRLQKGQAPSLVESLPSLLPPDLQAHPVAARFFTKQLRNNNCLILLDGMDEVPSDKDYRLLMRAIESALLAFEGNPVFVTSRVAGWRWNLSEDFRIYHIGDLSEGQLKTFIDTWYSAVELNSVVGRLKDEPKAMREARIRRARSKAGELASTIQRIAGIRQLASNPMLLSIICLIHRSLATLPHERAKLYRECAQILLEQWDLSRGVHVDDTGLRLAQKERIMGAVAFGLHSGISTEGVDGVREASWVEVERLAAAILPELGRDAGEASRLLKRLVDRSGLLVERRRGILGFSHLSFQEYFAAFHLGERGSEAPAFLLEGGRVRRAWWREVVFLYCGLSTDASAIINELLGEEDDFCKQTLRLAGLCYHEATGLRDPGLPSRVANRLYQVRVLREEKADGALSARQTRYLALWAGDDRWYEYAALSSLRAVEAREGASGLKAALAGPEEASRRGAYLALLACVENGGRPDVVELLEQELVGNSSWEASVSVVIVASAVKQQGVAFCDDGTHQLCSKELVELARNLVVRSIDTAPWPPVVGCLFRADEDSKVARLADVAVLKQSRGWLIEFLSHARPDATETRRVIRQMIDSPAIVKARSWKREFDVEWLVDVSCDCSLPDLGIREAEGFLAAIHKGYLLGRISRTIADRISLDASTEGVIAGWLGGNQALQVAALRLATRMGARSLSKASTALLLAKLKSNHVPVRAEALRFAGQLGEALPPSIALTVEKKCSSWEFDVARDAVEALSSLMATSEGSAADRGRLRLIAVSKGLHLEIAAKAAVGLVPCLEGQSRSRSIELLARRIEGRFGDRPRELHASLMILLDRLTWISTDTLLSVAKLAIREHSWRLFAAVLLRLQIMRRTAEKELGESGEIYVRFGGFVDESSRDPEDGPGFDDSSESEHPRGRSRRILRERLGDEASVADEEALGVSVWKHLIVGGDHQRAWTLTLLEGARGFDRELETWLRGRLLSTDAHEEAIAFDILLLVHEELSRAFIDSVLASLEESNPKYRLRTMFAIAAGRSLEAGRALVRAGLEDALEDKRIAVRDRAWELLLRLDRQDSGRLSS